MEYTQALGWLDEQEGGKEAVEAIRAHVTGINKGLPENKLFH
ncbi:MAG: hypothetical protein ACYTXF_35925 [Nostoc sp.]